MRQRRRLKALLNEGFSATVSLRALISLLPIISSFAQDGIKPQRFGQVGQAQLVLVDLMVGPGLTAVLEKDRRSDVHRFTPVA